MYFKRLFHCSLALTFHSISLLQSATAQNLEKSRSVWVEQGLVRGKIYKIADQQVQIFRGIPYAEPPVGKLRFRKPVKKTSWSREWQAIDYGAPCIQFMDFHRNDRFASINMRSESEDCLFLNIFSPYDSEDESQLYPILVWIHGGSFLAGSADTGIEMETVARNIVFNGVALVTVNYRLGPLGFMSVNHGDKVEGNFGIWDQKLALEWIQRNMKQFNGDPTKVTLMGESAGAAGVSVLALSPLTKGLVQQAIAMSGSSTAGWAIQRHGVHPWDMANIAEYMRCNKLINDDDLAEILSREMPTERLRSRTHCNLQDSVPDCLVNGGNMNVDEMMECFRNEVNFSAPLFRRALAAELGVSKMVVDNELITDSGVEFVKANARIPILTGVARREWAHKKPEFYQFFRYENISGDHVAEAVRKIVETAYVARLPGRVSNSTIDLIANATFLRYMQDIDFYFDMPGVVSRLQDLEADIEFVSPCQIEVDAYVENNLDVFVYSFDYVPKGSLVEEEKRFYPLFGDNAVTISRRDQNIKGFKQSAFHGLDHAFIFSQGYSSNFHVNPFSKRDKAMSKLLTKMITNFVAKGNPSTENFNWPVYANDSDHYVSLDLPPRVIKGSLHYPSPSFWNDEAAMLSHYTLSESKFDEQSVSELTMEERIQLEAYRRAWHALWIFVVATSILIISVICCIVYYKGRSPTSKPY